MILIKLKQGDMTGLESAISHMRQLLRSGDLEVHWARQIAFRKQDALIGIAMEQVYERIRDGETYSDIVNPLVKVKEELLDPNDVKHYMGGY